MNRYAMAPLLAMLLSAPAGAAADPDLLKLATPEAKVLYGIQVQRALASPFGQFAISRLLGNDAAARFAAASGFDAQRDLREILVASSGANAAGGADALILARGVFPADRFKALATASGATISDYHGVSVIRPAESGAPGFAFLDTTTLAIGSEGELRGVIDRRAGPSALPEPLFQKAQDASAAGDAWFATVTPLAELIPAPPSGGFNPATLLQSVIETWAGLHFDASGVTVAAEALTHSEAEAQGLAGVLKLAAGMVKGTAADALRNAQVSTSGRVTRITLTVAEQDLERSFPLAAPKRAAR